MPGPQPPPGVPPEVPEEFADAYRAAYERAMAEQSSGARHLEAEDHDDATDETPDDERWAHQLPRRTTPPRDATHREEPVVVHEPRAARDTRWLAPLLLVLIALLLVVGAFVLGRVFAASVGG